MSVLHGIPSNLTPAGTITVPVSIPHDEQWVGLLLGALLQLESLDYYELDSDYGNAGAQAVTAQWRDTTITPLIESIANGDSCGVTMTLPIGSSIPFFGSTAPDGFLFCDGAAIDRVTYADLFAVLGTTFGVGDGSTTFNLPDMRGRAPIGVGTGTGLTGRSLGDSVGEETHLLTTTEIPAHTHGSGTLFGRVQSTSGSNQNSAGGSSSGGGTFTGNINGATASTGGGGAHNNMQPSLVCNFIIKT